MSYEQKLIFINHEIIFLNAAELSTLTSVLGTCNHLNTIKLI